MSNPVFSRSWTNALGASALLVLALAVFGCSTSVASPSPTTTLAGRDLVLNDGIVVRIFDESNAIARAQPARMPLGELIPIVPPRIYSDIDKATVTLEWRQRDCEKRPLLFIEADRPVVRVAVYHGLWPSNSCNDSAETTGVVLRFPWPPESVQLRESDGTPESPFIPLRGRP